MWMEEGQRNILEEDNEIDSDTSGEELPIWVRGEQRWVSGIIAETTCQDIVTVLVRDEISRGKCTYQPERYHITERWRGVEQPLDLHAPILDIWNAWGTAQPEVKILLRRIKDDRFTNRKRRCKSDSSTKSDRSAYKTIHPRRIHALQIEKEPSSTEQLIKLVLAQGEVIRKQLKKLRNSEYQIGFLEEKTHKARERKHGSNYLLETYLRGLSEAVNPNIEENQNGDRNSDSGVVTEVDSEQSNHNNKPSSSVENERFSPCSDKLENSDKDDDEESVNEITLKQQTELLEAISKINKKILKEEECLVRFYTNIKKSGKENKSSTEEVTKLLTNLRAEMAKTACEMQHNEIVLEETIEKVLNRKEHLESLHKDLINEDQEYEMLQALLYSTTHPSQNKQSYTNIKTHYTKEVLDTLV